LTTRLDAEDPIERAAAVAALGVSKGRVAGSAAALDRIARHDPDGRVRSAAVAARVRRAPRGALATWRRAAGDADPRVRRRAAEVAPALAQAAVRGQLVALLADADELVAEAAAFALGERVDADPSVVEALASAATTHRDVLVREAAVAALGAIGDEAGLPAILAATGDKPAIRRRAVLALAPFAGPEVDAAVAAALTDHDWQVRQAAEDLTAR
jgi:hypothetical protein